jgi:hypothetical protein
MSAAVVWVAKNGSHGGELARLLDAMGRTTVIPITTATAVAVVTADRKRAALFMAFPPLAATPGDRRRLGVRQRTRG